MLKHKRALGLCNEHSVNGGCRYAHERDGSPARCCEPDPLLAAPLLVQVWLGNIRSECRGPRRGVLSGKPHLRPPPGAPGRADTDDWCFSHQALMSEAPWSRWGTSSMMLSRGEK